MHWMMLSCEDATLLITKKSEEKLSIKKRMQLSIHLMSCKLCSTYASDTEVIDRQIKDFRKEPIQTEHLRDTKKQAIVAKITSNE